MYGHGVVEASGVALFALVVRVVVVGVGARRRMRRRGVQRVRPEDLALALKTVDLRFGELFFLFVDDGICRHH